MRAGVVTVKSLRDLANSMRHLHLRELGKAERGEPDFTFGAPGGSWNDLFLRLVQEAQQAGATEDDVAELASTYDAYGDPDFMRKVMRKDGTFDRVKGLLERILGR
jgi:hypothetical protein